MLRKLDWEQKMEKSFAQLLQSIRIGSHKVHTKKYTKIGRKIKMGIKCTKNEKKNAPKIFLRQKQQKQTRQSKLMHIKILLYY